jgi:hypothetical protein
LQVPDKVKSEGGILLPDHSITKFINDFLNPIFAQISKSGGTGFAYKLYRKRLGNGNKSDFFRVPPTAGSGSADPLGNLFQAFLE